MLNGQVVYKSSGTFKPAWRPTITKFTSDIDAGGNYQIFGTQFNGLSQANAFGDEFQVSTNFPLVRITNNATGDVKYAHTYNFSTMGVATGSAPVSTWFDVPTNAETGDSTLEVVANGIPSLPVNVTIGGERRQQARTELRATSPRCLGRAARRASFRACSPDMGGLVAPGRRRYP